MVAAYFAVIGLCMGSFTNVLIARVPNRESIRGWSRCPSCEIRLRSRELVPLISWTLLRGKCRSCRSKISPIYPLVEVATALLVMFTALSLPLTPALVGWALFATLAVALSVIDLQTLTLPDPLVLATVIVGIVFFALEAFVNASWQNYLSALMTGVLLTLSFGVIRVVSKGGIGLGDVKLAAAVGLFLGFQGWRHTAFGVFSGFALGALVGVALMAFGRGGRKTALPFGPFMLAGVWLDLFLAHSIPWQMIIGAS